MTTITLLNKIGMSTGMMGYYYLAELIDRRRRALCGPTKSLRNYRMGDEYKAVAEAFDTTPSAVERCCRTAIKQAYSVPRGEAVLKEIAVYDNETLPNNKAFICFVADYLGKQEV